jgi:chemotaxis protein MotA
MDVATILGLVVGWGLMLWAILRAGRFSLYCDASSVMIVGGGTVAALLLAFPLRHLLKIGQVVGQALFTLPRDPGEAIRELVRFADIARRDGILALEAMTRNIADPFLVSGIQMAVDGTDPEQIEQIMISELEAMGDRHADGKALLDNVAKYAPAFGMIGTLIGLVAMLSNMSEPSKIGAGMAVAILTTLYGALVAYLLAQPLSEKLAKRSREELLIKAIIIRGVMAIQSGDNPRIVEQKLKMFLPVAQRRGPATKAA